MRLKHWRILRHAQRIEQQQTGLRWLDLYAAQALIDQSAIDANKLSATSESASIDCLIACSAAPLFGFDAMPVDVPGYRDFASRALSHGLKLPEWPMLHALLDQLESVQLLARDGVTRDSKRAADSPLVSGESGVFLRRVWEQQQFLDLWLAQQQEALLASEESDSPRYQSWVVHNFKRLFPAVNVDPEGAAKGAQCLEVDGQALAAAQALTQRVTLVSGGPGTGKTSTAARILILYQLQHLAMMPEGAEATMRIRLLAPTGKAAVRLYHSVLSQYERLLSSLSLDQDMLDRLRASLPAQGETIHRVLMEVQGGRGPGSDLQYDDVIDPERLLLGAPAGDTVKAVLDADIVMVDEASMIDRKLMVDLLSILPESGKQNAEAREEHVHSGFRLLFLGDHYQLPPVESGEAFARWVRRYSGRPFNAQQSARMSHFYPAAFSGAADQAVPADGPPCLLAQLHKTFRFGGPIHAFAQSLRNGRVPELEQLLPELALAGRSDGSGDLLSPTALRWVDLGLAEANEAGAVQLAQAMDSVLEAYRSYFEKVNRGADPAQLMEEKSRYQILCATYEGPLGVNTLNRLVEQRFAKGELYAGKVIMVTSNQPALKLFNGDVGIVMAADASVSAASAHSGANYLVYFPEKDTLADGVSLSMIHAWQSAYAISIHKSQGSEYERVVVMAPDYAGELLTPRLVYTGVTRSQRSVELWISRQALLASREEPVRTE